MKFLEYPPIVELQDNQSFLVSGPDGTKQILTKDAIDSLLKLTDYRFYNPNLLDNPDCLNSVNQREIKGLFENEGQYFVDRWKLVEGSVSVDEDGWLLNGTIQQPMEFSIGQETTATVLTTTGIIDAEYDDDEKVYQITASNKKILRPKLEVGKFSTIGKKEAETWICADPPPKYTLEHTGCLRYFNAIFLTTASFCMLGSTNFYSINAFFPVRMRAVPTYGKVAVVIYGTSGQEWTTQEGSLTCYEYGTSVLTSKKMEKGPYGVMIENLSAEL